MPGIVAIWAVELALLGGILLTVLLAFRAGDPPFRRWQQVAVSGALLASINTATEYGFGAVIAALPGFLVIKSTRWPRSPTRW